MSKKIWERFPKHIRRTRTQRGSESAGKILSLPTEEEFFKSLFDKTILLKRRVVLDHVDVLSIYINEDHKYGLLFTGWCICNLCTDPIAKCYSDKSLQSLIDNCIKKIGWFDSLDELLANAGDYVTSSFFIDSILELIKS